MIANQRYNKGFVVVPSDTVNFTPQGMNRPLIDALYCGGAGIVQAVFEDGTVIPFTVVAGEILPIAIKRVNATSTTATLLVALYGL